LLPAPNVVVRVTPGRALAVASAVQGLAMSSWVSLGPALAGRFVTGALTLGTA
jgi:hypothetical protein